VATDALDPRRIVQLGDDRRWIVGLDENVDVGDRFAPATVGAGGNDRFDAGNILQ
jgi:hypothetical protein